MRFRRFLLYLITLLVYTQGFLERFTYLPASLMIEICVWMLALVSFKPKVGLSRMVGLILIGLCASMATHTVIPYFKHIRFVLYFYVVYTALWNMRFSIAGFGRYLRFNVAMVLFQGIASIINLYFFGRAEYNVGAMSSLGGTTATAYPLLVVVILLVVYYYSSFSKKASWHLCILLMVASVFLLAFSCGKRAVFIFVPIYFVIITIICSYTIKKHKSRKLIFIIGLVILVSPVFFWGLQQTEGFNYYLSGRESEEDTAAAALDYAKEYEESESQTRATTGRSNTTMTIIKHAIASEEGWLIGYGFASMKDENEIARIGVAYGFVGITRDIISGGIIFALYATAFMLFLIFRRNVETKDSFSKVMRIALALVFVGIHFIYSSDFTVSLKLNMILAPLLCFLNSANYVHIKDYYCSIYLNR